MCKFQLHMPLKILVVASLEQSRPKMVFHDVFLAICFHLFLPYKYFPIEVLILHKLCFNTHIKYYNCSIGWISREITLH